MSNRKRIKPSGFIKLTTQGKTHISDSIRRELEVETGESIPYVSNAHTIVLFNPNLSKEDILRSLEVIKLDLELREKKEEE